MTFLNLNSLESDDNDDNVTSPAKRITHITLQAQELRLFSEDNKYH